MIWQKRWDICNSTGDLTTYLCTPKAINLRISFSRTTRVFSLLISRSREKDPIYDSALNSHRAITNLYHARLPITPIPFFPVQNPLQKLPIKSLYFSQHPTTKLLLYLFYPQNAPIPAPALRANPSPNGTIRDSLLPSQLCVRGQITVSGESHG